MEKPDISVIITCYNKKETIIECLKSVLSQELNNLEIIVVDDGSNDGSSEAVKGFLSSLNNQDRVKLLRVNRLGPALAKNAGFKHASGDGLLFLDGDCVVKQGSLQRLVRMFKSDPSICCVGGEVRSLNSGRLIARMVEYMQNEVERSWPFGAFVAYRRGAFEAVGCFDGGMVAGEDGDLFLRVKKAGFNCIPLNKDVKALTVNPDTLTSFFKQRLKWGVGYAQLTEKHPEALTLRIKLCFVFTAVLLASIPLALIDARLALIPLITALIGIAQRVPKAIRIARKAKERKCVIFIPLLSFLNATAYFLGYSYWKLLESLGRRKRLNPVSQSVINRHFKHVTAN